MSLSNPRSRVIVSLSVIGIAVIAKPAMAHSSIDMPPPYYVSESSVNAAYRIVHGCYPSGGDEIPVIAESFIFPTQSPRLERQGGGKIHDTNRDGVVDLYDITDAGSLVGTFQPNIDHRIFKQMQLKEDDPSLGNPIGFSATQGKVPTKFYGDTPLVLNPIFFSADTCVKELVVHPVAADICKFTKSPRDGDANIWMEHPTAKFPNPLHGVGENSLRISFQRNLDSNPLRRRCRGGYTVDVFASDADIDAHLSIPGVWPAP